MLPFWIDFGSLPVTDIIPFVAATLVMFTSITMGFVGRT